ncbi:MAG: M48 family metallopeptidase [Cellulosilyticaceae bacterium]
MQLTLENQTFVFNVEYSKRKKFYLHISPEGHITVKAPSKSTEEEVLDFVTSQKKTLLEDEKQRNSRKTIHRDKSYDEEAHFLYLGKACTLNQLLPEVPEGEDAIQEALKKFYTAQTKVYIKQNLKRMEKLMGVKAKSTTIVDSPRTWGTCNNHKELTFNYRLSMAPPSVIDYVIIHELCHLLHLNHDRSFWRKVGMYDTDYKKHEAYLARVGGVMTI